MLGVADKSRICPDCAAPKSARCCRRIEQVSVMAIALPQSFRHIANLSANPVGRRSPPEWKKGLALRPNFGWKARLVPLSQYPPPPKKKTWPKNVSLYPNCFSTWREFRPWAPDRGGVTTAIARHRLRDKSPLSN